MSSEDSDKSLKLNIAICKRLQKEVASYEKEVILQEQKIQNMKSEGKDFYGKGKMCLLILVLIFNFRYSQTRRSFARKLHDDS